MSEVDIRAAWQWELAQLESWQLDRLNEQLSEVLPRNEFYRARFGSPKISFSSVGQLEQLPLMSKSDLTTHKDTHLCVHQTYDVSSYTRLHRTSGTTGQPLLIRDTSADWKWWSNTWQHVLEAASVTARDRVFLAFSFGPFIGFWSAHQACADRGCMVIPGGGLSSLARLEFLRQSQATVLCCTPSYALHLADVAKAERINLRDQTIRRIIVAGEAGGSLPSVRNRIESSWNAKVVDHAGATEVGPWGFGFPDRPGIHIIETSFIVELLQVTDNVEATWSLNSPSFELSEPSELVLTSLGRLGAPVFRYRTGDIVRARRIGQGDCKFVWLEGGVIGRADDMVTIRGVNIFPSSVESIIREIPDIEEYRVVIQRQSEMDQIAVEVEGTPSVCEELRKKLQTGLGLRIDTTSVPVDSLPRSETKAKRWIDLRDRKA